MQSLSRRYHLFLSPYLRPWSWWSFWFTTTLNGKKATSSTVHWRSQQAAAQLYRQSQAQGSCSRPSTAPGSGSGKPYSLNLNISKAISHGWWSGYIRARGVKTVIQFCQNTCCINCGLIGLNISRSTGCSPARKPGLITATFPYLRYCTMLTQLCDTCSFSVAISC